jgi:hypothetical protein
MPVSAKNTNIFQNIGLKKFRLCRFSEKKDSWHSVATKISSDPLNLLQNVISGVKRRARLCLEQNVEHFIQHLL